MQERFGKTTGRQQALHASVERKVGQKQLRLGRVDRVQSVEVVAAGQRISGSTKCIQACASGHQQGRLVAELIDYSF